MGNGKRLKPLFTSVAVHGILLAVFSYYARAKETAVERFIQVQLVGSVSRPPTAPPIRRPIAKKLPVLDRKVASAVIEPTPDSAPVDSSTPSDAASSAYGDAGSQTVRERYFQDLRALIERQKLYPSSARSRGQTGRVTVSFAVHPDGKLDEVRIFEPCQYEALNEAALETFFRVRAVPPVPVQFGGATLRLQVALKFELD